MSKNREFVDPPFLLITADAIDLLILFINKSVS